MRGSLRFCAQRPLPSMITAPCCEDGFGQCMREAVLLSTVRSRQTECSSNAKTDKKLGEFFTRDCDASAFPPPLLAPTSSSRLRICEKIGREKVFIELSNPRPLGSKGNAKHRVRGLTRASLQSFVALFCAF